MKAYVRGVHLDRAADWAARASINPELGDLVKAVIDKIPEMATLATTPLEHILPAASVVVPVADLAEPLRAEIAGRLSPQDDGGAAQRLERCVARSASGSSHISVRMVLIVDSWCIMAAF